MQAVLRGRKHNAPSLDEPIRRNVIGGNPNDRIKIVAGVDDIICDLCSKHATSEYERCHDNSPKTPIMGSVERFDSWAAEFYGFKVGETYTRQDLLKRLKRYTILREVFFVVALATKESRRIYHQMVENQVAQSC